MHHKHIKRPEQTHDSGSNHHGVKQVHTRRLDAQAASLPLYLQRSRTQLLQRQPLEEEEEQLQLKYENYAKPSQALESEEKILQEKSDNDVAHQYSQKEQAIQKKSLPHFLQAKLKIGAPNNKYEQKADRVADQVMRMPEPKVQRQAEPEEEEEEAVPEREEESTPTLESVPTRDAEQLGEEETVQTKPIANTITPVIQCQSEPEEEEEEELQAKGEMADVGEAKRIAREGFSGAGETLPHLAEIQRSFGLHDVTGVKAHVGGVAKVAIERLGAEAYAAGDQVAFKSMPDLHTAAHETAHVVQQRRGVQLKGGVGEVGDQYEQNADEVAERVVRGQSAESLLAESPTLRGTIQEASEAGSGADKIIEAKQDDLLPEDNMAVIDSTLEKDGAEKAENASLPVQMIKPRFVSDMILGPHKGSGTQQVTAACKAAKKLVLGLYRKYGQQSNKGYFDTSDRNFRKKYYNFRWRENLRKVGNKILAGKWYFSSTKKLFLRLWSGLKHYESRVKHRWKNIGRRTPLGLEKERRLRVKYGYTFQCLKGNDVGINRCTILNPNREVLYYKISYHEIEQVVPKLYSYARNSLKFKLAPKSRPPFSYATCFTEAKQEYRRMNRFRKIAALTNFKNALALAACLEREWGSNCPSLGRWAAQVIAAVNGSHGRGNRNWVLIKGIYQIFKNRLGSKLFSQLALNFATGGKWKRYEK